MQPGSYIVLEHPLQGLVDLDNETVPVRGVSDRNPTTVLLHHLMGNGKAKPGTAAVSLPGFRTGSGVFVCDPRWGARRDDKRLAFTSAEIAGPPTHPGTGG